MRHRLAALDVEAVVVGDRHERAEDRLERGRERELVPLDRHDGERVIPRARR